MKLKDTKVRAARFCAAFTLTEMMVTVAAGAILGICIYRILNSGMILYAKNSAINAAHDQARIGVARMVKDIHGAISVPQLGHIDPRPIGSWAAPAGSWTPYGTSLTFAADPGTGPTAGVAFQVLGGSNGSPGGPWNVTNDPANNIIMIASEPYMPQLGQRLLVPYYGMEGDIIKCNPPTQNGSHYNVWTANGIETQIQTKNGTYIICYYSRRVAYVVENGELHFYASDAPPAGSTWPVTIARNLINPADRTQPATPFTQASTQYVGVNLTTEDQHYTNRGFKSTNTLVAGSIPYYSQIAIYQ